MKKYYYLLFTLAGFILSNYTKAESSLQNPLGDNNLTTQQIAGRIVGTTLGIVGSIALIMFIFGGFTWMTAGGNEERIKRGRDTLMWSTIGIIIIFAAYAILRFIFEALV